MKNNHLPNWVRVLLLISALGLVMVLFVPMWQIELNAPQYPEGLVLKIYPNKLAGSVEIINGLNHYIGMKTLHTKDFIEFNVLPYIIGFFALLSFVVAFLNRRKWLYFLTILFIAFGVVAMVDFWRWEYDYGHDLNPEAAIQIPGMAYQPPLIGYKQLLNFGAYSIPDQGGFIFIAVGCMLVISAATLLIRQKNKKSAVPLTKEIVVLAMFFFPFFLSCNTSPQSIKIGKDECSYCKMTISDSRFGGEIISKKGKVFKFDDIHCLLSFKKEVALGKETIANIYLVNFTGTHQFIEPSKAWLLKSNELNTPMGGNVAAFETQQSLLIAQQKFKGNSISWNTISK